MSTPFISRVFSRFAARDNQPHQPEEIILKVTVEQCPICPNRPKHENIEIPITPERVSVVGTRAHAVMVQSHPAAPANPRGANNGKQEQRVLVTVLLNCPVTGKPFEADIELPQEILKIAGIWTRTL